MCWNYMELFESIWSYMIYLLTICVVLVDYLLLYEEAGIELFVYSEGI